MLSVFEPQVASEGNRPEALAPWTRDLPPVLLVWDKGDPATKNRAVDLATVLDDIRGLRDWAIEIEKKAGEFGPTPRSDRRERDYARDVVLKALLRIWRDIFEQPIATSTFPLKAPPDKRGRATGPLIRFLEVCLSFIEGFPDQTANALRDHVNRLKPELTTASRD